MSSPDPYPSNTSTSYKSRFRRARADSPTRPGVHVQRFLLNQAIPPRCALGDITSGHYEQFGWSESGLPPLLAEFYQLLFACSSLFRLCWICGHRSPDPSAIAPSQPFLPLILLLSVLMGTTSEYLDGGGAAEVGLGSGSAVLSPEVIYCTCRTFLPCQLSCCWANQPQSNSQYVNTY